VRSLQPDAVIFSDVGPDIRWVGNERGFANDPCWATYDPVGEGGGPASPGNVNARQSTTGTRNGSKWLPPECDVSIRPGWFWHERENSRVKTADQLMDLYYRSVGHGANLLLNVPPDRRGLLHETDAAVLREFGTRLRRTQVGWASGLPSISFRRPTTFNLIRIRENIALGQRIDAFTVEADGLKIAEGTSIGARRLIRMEKDVTARRVALKITQSAAPPVIAEFSLFHAT
jgi:alpha-L-fucosidase